jgi:outer membrane protein OmpA-like peptidoglycan-associated protein
LETSLEREHRAVIYGIYFDFNSATIKPQSATVLHTIADVMKKNSDWALTVEGHTDNIGGNAANQDLSARRAAAVRTALIELGISETRLLASGFGASAPRDTNTTLAGRARNRRVELTRQ